MIKARAARFGVLVGASLAALLIAGPASRADSYSDVPDVRSGDAAAIALDPGDSVPQIGSRYEHHCHEDCHEHHHHHGGDRDDYGRDDWPGPDRNTAFVDCSGRNPHAFRSVSEAAMFTPPNGTILILPPDPGMTCVETVRVLGPVTITSDGPTPAVIQAPPHQPCLIANIPLGDKLVVRNVKFIARGRDEPCVQIRAGAVTMDHVQIDSRNTDWAFDVGQSGELTLNDSRIETDGSGVMASRAEVELSNVEIDVEEGKNGYGLALDRTDGSVDGGRILGGAVGAVVSAGPHGLSLAHIAIDKTQQALVIDDGEQGVVSAQNIAITNDIEGILVSPGAEARLDGISVEGTRDTAVSLYGGRTELSASHISGAAIGVALAPRSSWKPDCWDKLFHRVHVLPEAPEDYLLGKDAHITGNEIADVRYGFDLSDGGPAVIAGNSIVARKECFEGDGNHIDRHDNRCHDDD